MTRRWLGYCAASERGELARALRAVDPRASIAFAHSAEELRQEVLTNGVGQLGVIVGLTDSGVSDVNLAAAIVRDGAASKVVLVARGASGSLKSRALSAGVADVIDVTLLPGRSAIGDPIAIDEPDFDAEDVPTTLVVAHTPSPASVPEVVPGEGGNRPSRARGTQARQGGTGTQRPWSGQWHVVEEASADGSRAMRAQVGPGEEGLQMAPAQTAAPVRKVARSGQGAILVFVSGRGGVGKTTLVALSAAIASSWGMRVALCDLDLTCGNLYSCFGLAHGCDLAQVTREGAPNAADLQRMGQAVSGDLRLWGPCGQPEMAETVSPHVTAILQLLAARFDLVLVDTSTAFTDAVAQAAQAADRLLLVSDGGVGTAAAIARLGALAVRLGVARTRIVRMSNRCDPKGRDEVVLNRANVGLETARDYRVLDGGEEVSELMAAGGAMSVPEAVTTLGTSLASALAKTLKEMGRLPASEAAVAAAREEGPKRRRRLGRRRKAS